MIIKSLIILCVFTVVQSATIKQRNIPVEIRYDDKVQGGKNVKTLKEYVAENAEVNDKVVQEHDPVPADKMTSENVKEFDQALPVIEPVKVEIAVSDDVVGSQAESVPAPVKNNLNDYVNTVPAAVVAENLQEPINDAPVQVSNQIVENIKEIDESVNNAVPVDSTKTIEEDVKASESENIEIVKTSKIERIEDNALPVTSAVASKNLNGQLNIAAKTQLSPDELSQSVKHLPVLAEIEIPDESIAPKTIEEPDKPITQKPVVPNATLFQEIQEIISNGLKRIRDTFKPEKGQTQPKPEQWDDLEKAVGDYLEEAKGRIQVKQAPAENQNFFQNIASGFQTITNNFVQGLQGGNNTTGQGDEGQPGSNQGGFQGFVSFFQGGVNNIANSIQNLGQQSTTSNTVLGDTGSTTQAPNLISNIVSNVQQFFGGIQGGSQSGGPIGIQGDTGTNSSTTSNQQGGPVQVIQSIGSAFTSIFQQRPPNAPGDEGTNATQNVNFIQSIGQNIGNAIQQFNPFRPENQNAGTSQPAAQPAKPAEVTGTKTEEAQQGGEVATSESKNPPNVPVSQPAPAQPGSPEPPNKRDDETTLAASPSKIEENSEPINDASKQKNEIKPTAE